MIVDANRPKEIPTIRLADTVKPVRSRKGDADAICAAEAKRARKRAKRLEARNGKGI